MLFENTQTQTHTVESFTFTKQPSELQEIQIVALPLTLSGYFYAAVCFVRTCSLC